jgi:uncharacterized membrane protein
MFTPPYAMDISKVFGITTILAPNSRSFDSTLARMAAVIEMTATIMDTPTVKERIRKMVRPRRLLRLENAKSQKCISL